MIVKVRQLAFTDVRWQDVPVREVEIPHSEWNRATKDGQLALIWHYGQNEFQPKDTYSLSCGDVIEWENTHTLILICGIGYQTIDEKEYRKLCEMSVQDRQFNVLKRVV